MAGYKNYSMSNNAVSAYNDGEMPMSKWTKQAILNELENQDNTLDINNLSRLMAKELKAVLYKSSWHHTSNMYNKTDFYAVNSSIAEDLDVDAIIASRVPREKKVEEKPTYISAIVKYTEWEGTRKHPKPIIKTDFVTFMSNDKMVKCPSSNNFSKRLNSLTILAKIEQKTKFAEKNKVEKLLNK